MAAKVETAEQEQTNTIDPVRLKKEVGRIENAIAAKESHKMGYVESCKPFNEAVANAYEMATAAAGVPMAVLKATIKQRALQRKIEGIPEKFEDEARETFDMVCQALGDFGDLPLGQAAKERAANAEGKTVPPAAEEPKKRGRPRKAPSPGAAPAAPAAAPASTEPAGNGDDADNDLRPPHLQRSEADREKDLADARAAEENAARLKAGISPLH